MSNTTEYKITRGITHIVPLLVRLQFAACGEFRTRLQQHDNAIRRALEHTTFNIKLLHNTLLVPDRYGTLVESGYDWLMVRENCHLTSGAWHNNGLRAAIKEGFAHASDHEMKRVL